MPGMNVLGKCGLESSRDFIDNVQIKLTTGYTWTRKFRRTDSRFPDDWTEWRITSVLTYPTVTGEYTRRLPSESDSYTFMLVSSCCCKCFTSPNFFIGTTWGEAGSSQIVVNWERQSNGVPYVANGVITYTRTPGVSPFGFQGCQPRRYPDNDTTSGAVYDPNSSFAGHISVSTDYKDQTVTTTGDNYSSGSPPDIGPPNSYLNYLTAYHKLPCAYSTFSDSKEREVSVDTDVTTNPSFFISEHDITTFNSTTNFELEIS